MNSLITERLTLIPVASHDYTFMRQLVNTAGWLRFIGDRNVHSDDQAKAYINRILETPQLTYWVVRLHHQKIPIGIISLIKRDYLDHFDIGFAFLPEYQHKGYATEAAVAIMNHSKKNGISILLATLIPENIQSINLLKKLGFSSEQKMEINNEVIWLYKIRMV